VRKKKTCSGGRARVLFSQRGSAAWRAVDPRRVIAAIAQMERDYVFTLAFILVLTGLWALVNTLLGRVPYAGRLVSCAAGATGFVLAAAALGNLWSRFKNQVR